MVEPAITLAAIVAAIAAAGPRPSQLGPARFFARRKAFPFALTNRGATKQYAKLYAAYRKLAPALAPFYRAAK